MLSTVSNNSGQGEPPSPLGYKRSPHDYSLETKQAIEQAQNLVQSNDIDGAINTLLSMEKKARLNGDFKSVENCCLVILKVYERLGDVQNIIKYLFLLVKRRSQSETVQTSIIDYGAKTMVSNLGKILKKKLGDESKVEEQQERVIEALREISAGKLMVEAVRADLTMQLAVMKEKQGKKTEACKLIQEETPETYTSMEKRAKISYILEQIRLCIETKDFIRAKILAKKVDLSSFADADSAFEELEIKFFALQIEFYTYEKDPLELAKAHLAIFKTQKYQKNPKMYSQELKSAIIMLAAAPYSNSQVDMIHRILQNPKLNDLSLAVMGPEGAIAKELIDYRSFLEHFVTPEIVQWPIPEHLTIMANPLLKEADNSLKSKKGKTVLDIYNDDNPTFWVYKLLFDRVIQHDIRVVAKYYSKLYLDNLAAMLNLSPDQTEEYISGMVSVSENKLSEKEMLQYKLNAKIDRADGIVTFGKLSTPDSTLTDFTGNIAELLGLVEKTCHLIYKENMVNESVIPGSSD